MFPLRTPSAQILGRGDESVPITLAAGQLGSLVEWTPDLPGFRRDAVSWFAHPVGR
jgi:hypothetical protein